MRGGERGGSECVGKNKQNKLTVGISKAENVVNMDYPGPGYSVTVHLTFETGATEVHLRSFSFSFSSHFDFILLLFYFIFILF